MLGPKWLCLSGPATLVLCVYCEQGTSDFGWPGENSSISAEWPLSPGPGSGVARVIRIPVVFSGMNLRDAVTNRILSEPAQKGPRGVHPPLLPRFAGTFALFSLAVASPVVAQAPSSTDSTSHEKQALVSRWPRLTRADVGLAAVFVGGTVTLMPFDERITHALRSSSVQDSPALSSAMSAFRVLGDPGALLLGLGAYGAGRLTTSEPLGDIGWHTTEAIIVSGAVSAAVKYTLGRARPYAVADSNAHDYAFWRGFRKGGAYQSLPSGHVTAAFAAAGVLAGEARRRWPKRASWIVAGAYASATLVGVSRIYHDAHWASDVMLGAGIGTVAGRVLVRAHHDDRWNGIDRWLLPSGVSRGDRGELLLRWRWR